MRNQQSWMPMDRVTVCDVVEAGTCFDGVIKHLLVDGRIAGPPDSSNEWIARAAVLDGYGYGYGYGYGSGSGYGDGYGSGSGDGSGDGDGSGNRY